MDIEFCVSADLFPPNDERFDSYEGEAIALLLINEVIFISRGDKDQDEFVLCIQLSDSFYSSSSDCHVLKRNKVKELFEHWREDPEFGHIIYCMKERKQRLNPRYYDFITERSIWDLGELYKEFNCS